MNLFRIVSSSIQKSKKIIITILIHEDLMKFMYKLGLHLPYRIELRFIQPSLGFFSFLFFFKSNLLPLDQLK